MKFVIVGGGPTGVELAGSVTELARHALTYRPGARIITMPYSRPSG